MKILLVEYNKTTQPLQKLLDEISDSLRSKIFSKFQSFVQHGDVYSSSSLKTLNARIWKYKGTIYKLRVDSGNESARVLFAKTKDGDLAIIHAFLKSTRKTPAKEASQAIAVFRQLDSLAMDEWEL